MSDAHSQAAKDRRHAEEWLEGHGWKKYPAWRGSSYWTDPLNPDTEEPVRLQQALDLQQDRNDLVLEIMVS